MVYNTCTKKFTTNQLQCVTCMPIDTGVTAVDCGCNVIQLKLAQRFPELQIMETCDRHAAQSVYLI